jgi:hypothetical protein
MKRMKIVKKNQPPISKAVRTAKATTTLKSCSPAEAQRRREEQERMNRGYPQCVNTDVLLRDYCSTLLSRFPLHLCASAGEGSSGFVFGKRIDKLCTCKRERSHGERLLL